MLQLRAFRACPQAITCPIPYTSHLQTVADQAAYTALQNAWRGDSVSTAGTVTRNWGSNSGRRRSLLQSGGSSETRLPASAVGTWTNCSATCTYEVGVSVAKHGLERVVPAAATNTLKPPCIPGLCTSACLTRVHLLSGRRSSCAGPGQRAVQPAGARCGHGGQCRQRLAGLSV